MHIVQEYAAPEEFGSPTVVPAAGPGPYLAGSNGAQDDTLDEAWAVLSESLVIREQLNQACVEVKVTIDAIKMRLDRLALKIVDYDGAAPHPADQLRRRVS